MPGKLTIADLLDPIGRARRREKADELRLKAEIAGHKFQQEDRHHSDKMGLESSRLDLTAQIESRKIDQADRHHSENTSLGRSRLGLEDRHHTDRMGLESSRLGLDNRQLALSEQRTLAEMELSRARLESDRDAVKVSAETSRDVAKIQAITALTIAREGHGHELTLSDRNHEHAIDLAHHAHENAMSLAREQAHLETMKAAVSLPYEQASSAIRQTEETARAMSGAVADIFREKVRAKMTMKIEKQKERHRKNERQHENLRDQAVRELESLRSQLRNEEFSHAQQTSRIEIPLLLRELGLFEGSGRPSDEELTGWIDKLRARGTI